MAITPEIRKQFRETYGVSVEQAHNAHMHGIFRVGARDSRLDFTDTSGEKAIGILDDTMRRARGIVERGYKPGDRHPDNPSLVWAGYARGVSSPWVIDSKMAGEEALEIIERWCAVNNGERVEEDAHKRRTYPY